MNPSRHRHRHRRHRPRPRRHRYHLCGRDNLRQKQRVLLGKADLAMPPLSMPAGLLLLLLAEAKQMVFATVR